MLEARPSTGDAEDPGDLLLRLLLEAVQRGHPIDLLPSDGPCEALPRLQLAHISPPSPTGRTARIQRAPAGAAWPLRCAPGRSRSRNRRDARPHRRAGRIAPP